MYTILLPNPEAYRDWQERQYQQSLCNEEPELIRCAICGEMVPPDEAVDLFLGKYSCEGCIKAAMAEDDVNRTNAIVILTELTKTA